MLDPWTSLSLAASIVQFIDFGHKLLSESNDLYRAGKTVQHADLEIIYKDLREVTNSLQTRSKGIEGGQLTDDEQVCNKSTLVSVASSS